MSIIALFVFGVIGTNPTYKRPYQDTGAFLVEACKAVSVENPSPEQVNKSNICLAYLEGYADGRGPAFRYKCLADVSFPDIAKAYVAWMKTNGSAYMTTSKRLGVEAAMDFNYEIGCDARWNALQK